MIVELARVFVFDDDGGGSNIGLWLLIVIPTIALLTYGAVGRMRDRRRRNR